MLENCPRQSLKAEGLSLSRIVAGMWRMADWKMSVNQRADFIAQCLDLGVSSFDHADIYGDYTVEALFGEVLAREPGWRHRMELVSKCGIKLISKNRPAHRSHGYDTSRAHIIASAEQSLRNLQTDYLDLLLIHRPDPLMDFAEVAQAFTELQQAGKVRHFGVSNFSTAQFNALNQFFPLVTNQIELSPLHLQPMFDGSLDAMQAQGVSPMLWSALAGGRLFGNEARPALRKVLGQLEGQYKMSEAGIVYAWLMQLPCKPLPLTGSSRIAAVAEAVQACHLQLPREQWFEVLQAARGREVD